MMKLWKRLFKPHPFKQVKLHDRQKIVEAFEYNGRKYYMFDDIFSMPTIRGLMALDYYEELSMRCTREYLTAFCKAAENILTNNKKIDLPSLGVLIKHLQERLTMLPADAHVFKLASVVFFDESENPYAYDREYNKKKIDEWQQSPQMLSFFLSTPLKGLIPFLGSQSKGSAAYSWVAEQIDSLHLKEVTKHLSHKDTIPVM